MKIKTDLALLLTELKIDQNGKLPYAKNYIAYKDGVIKNCDIEDYLYFLQYVLEDYKKIRDFTFESFDDFINRTRPPCKQKTT